MKSHQPKQPPIIEMFARHWCHKENTRYNLGGLRREHPRTMCILKRSCDALKLTTGHSSHAIKAALMIVVEPDANCETPLCFVSSKIRQNLNLYLARFAKI
jgi:hypothetical protein